jgi:hypothetical protein
MGIFLQNLNAAKASFLQESEKKQLVKEICKSYNLEDESIDL